MEDREFGKFANGKELLHAYLELEKDYTKKCQKLAELLRKLEDVEIGQNEQNAEFCAKNDEHSIKNVQYGSDKTENDKKQIVEEISGIIANEDACCDSTFTTGCALEGDATEVEKEDEHDTGANLSDDKKPIYMSPLFGFMAKEFFGASAIAAVFEKDILELVAKDFEIACMPNALETAAERVLGRNIMQPVLGDRFVEVLCKVPQIKKGVIDLYLADLRGRSLPPVSVRTRSGAAAGRTKFDSIAEAGKHLLSRL